MVNAVKEEGIKIDGAYVTAQKEAGKELRSFDRYLDDLKIALGKPLESAFGNIVFGLSNLLKTFTRLVSEAGPVKDALYSIGAMASIITEPFLNFAKAVTNYFKPATKDMVEGTKFALKNMTATAAGEGQAFVQTLITKLSNAAESALRWGVKIVANLAEGMAQGAVWALTSAMNVIGNMLASWLSPGSPPRVAPGLTEWGQEAIASWLRGFTEGDFSMLEAIQGPLKSVLDVVGKSADFTALSSGLIEAISAFSESGAINESLFAKLASLGGVYGSELAKLTALQFALAKSTKAINDADKKYVDSQTKVSTLTSEYNKMMRSGASKEALKTKLAEINAAEKARDMAAKDKVAAVEKATALQEQAGLQAKLLSQLIELARAQQKAEPEREKEKKAGKAEPIEMPEIKMPGIDFSKPIDAAMEEAKKRLLAKLADIFAPLKKVWATIFGEDIDIGMTEGIAGVKKGVRHIPGLFDELVAKFEWFKGKVKLAWDYIVEALQPVIDVIKNMIPPDILNQLGRLAGIAIVVALAIGGISVVVGIVGGILAVLTSTVGLVVIAITGLYLAWTNNWGGIRDILTNIWTKFLEPVLIALWTFFTVTIPSAIKTLVGFWTNTLLPSLRGVWNFININVIPIFRALANVADAILGKASDILAGIWQNFILPALTAVWGFIDKNVMPILQTLGKFIAEILNPVLTFLHDNLLVPISKAFEAIGNFIGGVVSGLDRFAESIRKAQLPSWLQRKSPSELEQSLLGSGEAAGILAAALWGSPLTVGGALASINEVMGGAVGTLSDFEMLKSIAAGAKSTIGEPLAAALFMVRDAAAEAGSAVGGVFEGLQNLKSMNGMETHFWVFTHEVTVHEPDRTSGGGGTAGGGGGTSGGGPPEGFQHGGWTREGLYRLHNNEYVISEAMRAGRESMANGVLSPAALSRLSARPTIIEMMHDVTVSFPNANIASDMDLAAVDNRVRHVVRDEMRRR